MFPVVLTARLGAWPRWLSATAGSTPLPNLFIPFSFSLTPLLPASDPRLAGACEEALGRMAGEKATTPLSVLIRKGMGQFDAFKCNNVPAGTAPRG